MDYNKESFSFIKTHLKYDMPRYYHKIGHRKKWDKLRRSYIDKLVIEWPVLEEDDPKYRQEFKYINDKHKQLAKYAKILVCNGNFIEEIIKLAKKWNLYDIAIGIKDIETGKIVPYFADSELNMRLLTLWKCILSYQDILIIKKFKNTLRDAEIGYFNKVLNMLPEAHFYQNIEELMNSFNLSLIWRESILLLLLTGLFMVPQNLCPIKVIDDGSKEEIIIPILPETTLKDLKFNWKKIKRKKEEIYGKGRIKTTKDFNEYLKIYLEKEKSKKRYWDYVDFDNIPEGVKYEEAAHNRLRKGSLTVKKMIENVDKLKTEELKHIKMLKKFAGYEKGTFIY